MIFSSVKHFLHVCFALQLKQLESALQTNRPLPKTTTADIHAVVKALSSSPADQKEELQTLIPLVTALLEFPPHIVKKARSLTAAKRQTLVNLVSSILFNVRILRDEEIDWFF